MRFHEQTKEINYVSIKPKTPADVVVPLLPYLDMVLVMTVEPGFGGQGYIDYCSDKIRFLRKAIDEGGYDCELQKILDAFDKNPMLRGITLSGGEPFEQAERLLPLAKAIVERGKDVVAFSGYTFEELMKKSEQTPAVKELLSLCCLLIDGRFVLAERDLTLRFRGSRNQRLLDPVASMEKGEAVWSQL